VQAVFARLQDFPLSGPPREQLAPGLRVSFHGSYAIYYARRDGGELSGWRTTALDVVFLCHKGIRHHERRR
jgi:plasmid stabilization system protein ParE